MNTIKLGQIFCKKYNKEYNTDYTAKEIFTNVIVPLLFLGNEHLIIWGNSKFHAILQKGNVNGRKINRTSVEDIQYVAEQFCKEVENNEFNIMTSLNVFCGSTIPSWGATTLFSVNDNLYFNNEERYCSFIGSAFTLQSKEWQLVINNEDLIWKIFQGIQKYRYIIDNNTNLKGNQLPSWNSAFLIENNRDNDSNIVNEYFIQKSKDKLGIQLKDKINFINLLFLIVKKYPTKYIELFHSGQTNETCGAILLDVDYVKKQSDLFKKLYENVHEEFDYFDFDRCFGQHKLLNKAIQNGIITEGFFNPKIDISKNDNENKFKIKYLELIMTNEEKQLATEFANTLLDIKKSSRTNVRYDDFWKNKSVSKLTENLLTLPKNEVVEKVIEYLYNITVNENLNNFITYTQFKLKYNNQ